MIQALFVLDCETLVLNSGTVSSTSVEECGACSKPTHKQKQSLH